MTDFKTSKTLKLILDYGLTGQVGVRWQNDPRELTDPEKRENEGEWEYTVDERQLLDAANDIDVALKAMIALDWSEWQSRARAPDYTAELRSLAMAGMRLRLALMTPIPGKGKYTRAAKAFAVWFERTVAHSEPGEWRIEVINYKAPDRSVPWGLCFDPHTDMDLDEMDVTDPEHFRGFWCQHYGLAVRGRDQVAKEPAPQRDGKSMRLLAVLEQEGGGRSRLEESSPGLERDLRDDAKEEEVFSDNPDVYTRHVREAVQQDTQDTYLYLSLRSDVSREDNTALSVPEVTSLRAKSGKDVLMLVVLDGDAVIRGDRGKEWMVKMMDMAHNGLIATEVDIRNPQIRFLGWEVLSHILTSNKTIIDAVHDYRRQAWPLGLIYGVYCNPIHAYVKPPVHKNIDAIGKILRERRNAAIQ